MIKFLKIDPTFTLVWQNKGIVYDKLKNYTEVIKKSMIKPYQLTQHLLLQ